MLVPSILAGIDAPLLTPFHFDGNVNYEEYTRLTRFVTENGIHGVFVCGTTGEFINLTLEERKKLLTAAVEGAVPGTSILFNTTAMNLRDMKELFDWARGNGATAVSVTPPYYHKYKYTALVAYFQKASELAGDLPLYLYNMPGMTGNPITAPVLAEVCRTCPNVAGVKDSSMDFVVLQEYQCLDLPQGFELVTGNDAQALPALQAGCSGALIALASVYPALAQSVWDCFQAGKLDEAQAAQKKLILLRSLVREITPITSHKKLLEAQGFRMGPARFPMRDLSQHEADDLLTRAQAILAR
ncbi:MAG: dihydrodipicolinate synthase family protein [Angelakisella sp.]|jgi:4-hydroxy-tetrahydrodipicolinate synthase|nr:dihydrodipicolinate synthase family protein [Angelakisella sp.]